MSPESTRFEIQKAYLRRIRILWICGIVLTLLFAFVTASRHIAPRGFLAFILVLAVLLAVAGAVMRREAVAKLRGRPADPMGAEERRSIRRIIVCLQLSVVVLALALLNSVWRFRHAFVWPVLVEIAVSLLIQALLIRGILRLKKRLAAQADSGLQQTSHQSDVQD
jgi:archaellum biogenesis protein FlaJ (TadC family)